MGMRSATVNVIMERSCGGVETGGGRSSELEATGEFEGVAPRY